MKKEDEFKKVKELIGKLSPIANCGIFDTRNTVGDAVMEVFRGKFYKVDICPSWAYLEVFGCTRKEFKELSEYYYSLNKEEL